MAGKAECSTEARAMVVGGDPGFSLIAAYQSDSESESEHGRDQPSEHPAQDTAGTLPTTSEFRQENSDCIHHPAEEEPAPEDPSRTPVVGIAPDTLKSLAIAEINPAPNVSMPHDGIKVYNILDRTQMTVSHNVPYDAMSMPVYGPRNPYASRDAVESARIGSADQVPVDEADFKRQLRLFNRAEVKGANTSLPNASRSNSRTAGPQVASVSLIGVPRIDADALALATNAPFFRKRTKDKPSDATTAETAENDADFASKSSIPPLKRRARGDITVVEGPNAFAGPWADYDGFNDNTEDDENDDNLENTDAGAEVVHVDDEKNYDSANAVGAVAELVSGASGKSRLITPGSEKTKFHGRAERDYQGRTYMSPPTGLGPRAAPEECFVPKRCVQTLRGHTKGVNAIRLFPSSAHLLLSASMDHKVKIWRASGDERGAVLRTYLGHNRGVRDVCFDNTGARFMTASYDRYLKLWDTETGSCIHSFTTGKIPLCVRFNPDEDKQHIFLTGQQDKKIYQFDIRSGEITQEYNQHLGPVNTITFVDNNRKFVTTSDDKSLRAWEYDIPIVVKYIAEPHMHSMPATTLSPNKKWLACQSLDNQILLYGATDRFRLNRKKVFRGHIVAGYSCQVNFSPDCRYIMSGDSTGNMYYWDFKTCKLFQKQKAHENVVMGCEWHPFKTSLVFTCSWDNTIKIWD